MVDDGSDDRSRAIARQFADMDPRVRLLERPHMGIAHALNAAIDAARGRYIARMDGDDVSLPSRLQKQVAYLESHPRCVAVGCDLEVVDEEDRRIGSLIYPRRHPDIVDALVAGIGETLAHPTVVMRTEVLLAVGGYRADAMPVEDFALWLTLSEIGELANIPERLLRYRRHRETVCVRERPEQLRVTDALVGAARQKRRMRALRPRQTPREIGVSAAYHLECARIALKTGRRVTTARHTWSALISAPLWLSPYAALLACALPTRALHLLIKMYTRLRAIPFVSLRRIARIVRASPGAVAASRQGSPAATQRRELIR